MYVNCSDDYVSTAIWNSRVSYAQLAMASPFSVNNAECIIMAPEYSQLVLMTAPPLSLSLLHSLLP